jgi:spore coat polysaccharide biosynthesis protein SpsF
MKVVAIIPAHMGSTRLPGKVAKIIAGKPMLGHLITRLRVSRNIDEIVVATTEAQKDDQIVAIAEWCETKWFRGSETNVLERMFFAAKQAKADIIIRVTPDNPLTDPFVIDYMIEEHIKAKADYTWTDGMPIGAGAEVVSMVALCKANALAIEPYDREHVTPFIIRNKMMFKYLLLHSPSELNRPNYRLTVDYPADLELMTEIFNRLYKSGEFFSLSQVVELLDKNPELLKINERIDVSKK